MTHKILTADKLTKKFGGLVAVNEVSFTVEPNQIFGLIGPNGAGKTTLFNLITGLVQPSSGALFLVEDRIDQLKPHQIAGKGIARTFQNIRLFNNLTALENVMIGYHIHTKYMLPGIGFIEGMLGFPTAIAKERENKAQSLELLKLVGLSDRADDLAKNLAYGDQRRLEIARALAMRPKILLLDEPAAGMNPTEKHQLSEFIKELRSQYNLTIILIEHHVPLVMGLCDQIAVLNFGQLIALGEPEIVRNNPQVIEAYLGDE